MYLNVTKTLNSLTVNYKNPSFKRKPNPKEMQIYTSSLTEGLRLLNKQVDIILHNASAPSALEENTGIGSLFSRTVQEKLIPFLKAHGFSGIQQEPNNLRKPGDPSPYSPESSAKNIFMIPLEKLTTEKYGKILPESLYDLIKANNKSTDTVNYQYVNKEYEKALRVAYDAFKKSDILKPEFEDFKKNNSDAFERAAIYRILDNKYKTNWSEWKGIDKNLYSPKNEEEQKQAALRIAEIKQQNQEEIDYFIFKQFLIDVENKASNKLSKVSGIKIIGDSPVASPSADEWINQNLFLEGKAIGCPPDYFSKDGQRWGFKYFNPKYIFNPDGTLGAAGKILKEKYDNFFSSFPGGLRIDHIIGLVDPFIYTTAEKMTAQNSGRIYSIEGEFKKKPEEYSNILEKIVLQSAKEHGLNKQDVICEDLGDPNKPTQEVMKKLDLSGIAITQFDYRGAETPEKNVIMIGSHDNQSFLEYTEDFFKKVQGKNIDERTKFSKFIKFIKSKLKIKQNVDYDLVHFMTKTKRLAQDTAPKNAGSKDVSEYKRQIRGSKQKFMEAGFAELFTSPARRVQIFFTDFWGIAKTYNRPGTTEGSWSLRLGSDFENDYYKAVAEGKAPNLAKAVLTALHQRGLDKNHPELVKNLEASANILSEK